MTIVDFLLARIAEDQAVALAGIDGQADPENGWGYEGRALVPHVGIVHSAVQAEHIIRWHPHRVLAECEAKRRFVELHQPEDEMCGVCSHDIGYTSDGYGGEYYENHRTGNEWPCTTLRALAAIYSEHPDYRQDWA